MLLGILLISITAACVIWILLHSGAAPFLYSYNETAPNASFTSDNMVADVYQNGKLLKSIPLSSVTENYTFVVTGENGAENEIAVASGSIGIISANCPDKLCVHQGFIHNSLLPITCLPNRLVIQIRQEKEAAGESNNKITPDIITY